MKFLKNSFITKIEFEENGKISIYELVKDGHKLKAIYNGIEYPVTLKLHYKSLQNIKSNFKILKEYALFDEP